MESSEKWCALKDNCALPISNGLLADPAAIQNPTLMDESMSRFAFALRSVEDDMLGGNESDLTNSTCHYPFCVAVLSFTIRNSK